MPHSPKLPSQAYNSGMFNLRCTVRNCFHPLQLSEAGLSCEAGHHFDRAKGGYWNLTQPQDKKSLSPGDTEDAVLARHRWLQRGHAAGLIETIQRWIPDFETPPQIVDLGCGEGTFGPALFADHADGYCGIDLSRRAVKLAARHWPAATWVLANADRKIPAADSSVDCIVSLFGRRPVAEIHRVLKPNGCCLVAVPGQDDLIELRQRVQAEGKRRDRVAAIVEDMENHDLRCVNKTLWENKIEVGAAEIADALAMTYRAVRRSEQIRVAEIESTQVTLAADVMLFRSNAV